MRKIKKIPIIFLIAVFIVGTAAVGINWYCSTWEIVAAVRITWGSTGDTVREVQRSLRDLGYYHGEIDGIFGQGTYNAVRLFQQNYGLTVDGIVGDRTLAALGITAGGVIEEVTEEELQLLARIINGEGRGEPYEGQVAIGAVVLNRVESPDFPNTIAGVIYQRGAFDAVLDGQINLEPSESSLNAARDAVNGWDPTNGALYYWNPATATSRWIWTVPITTSIGRHVFGTK